MLGGFSQIISCIVIHADLRHGVSGNGDDMHVPGPAVHAQQHNGICLAGRLGCLHIRLIGGLCVHAHVQNVGDACVVPVGLSVYLDLPVADFPFLPVFQSVFIHLYLVHSLLPLQPDVQEKADGSGCQHQQDHQQNFLCCSFFVCFHGHSASWGLM